MRDGSDTSLFHPSSLNNCGHVVGGDLPARLAEGGAEPAQHHRGVRRLALLDEFDHALLAAFAFGGLEHAVVAARFGHVYLPLLPADSSCSHRSIPRRVGTFGVKAKEITIAKTAGGGKGSNARRG